MQAFAAKYKRRLLIFLMVFGPGVIAAVADNDAAGVATYSLIASKFGYAMLFILLIVTVLLAVTQEMGARLAVVTGKGLADLIREHYGVKISAMIFLMLFIANMGSIIANFAGLTAAISLFGLPKAPFLLLAVLFMTIFVYKGSYRTNQNIFLGSAFFYIAYIAAAFLAKPQWETAVYNLVLPVGITFSREFIFSAIALLGTTITPWGQFFIQSFIVDKKLTTDKLKYEQAEVYFGAFLTDLLSFFMIVAIAGTLFIHSIPINGAAEAALAITPFAGQFASLLFSFGLINAGFMGAVVISLTTAYAFSEFFGHQGSLDSPISKSRSFYLLFLIQIIIACLVVLSPHISLFRIVLYTQGLNGVLLPVIIFFLLRFANSKNLMGSYTNNRFYNYFATISCVVITLASIFVIMGGILGKI
ncbi:MAG TPA: divalent metal cation transporter [Patescibacteria group bacterium]|nr:divalent metal cation transporter [Patescibacteria group bacterium]